MTEEQLAEFQQKMLELGESITYFCETFEVMLEKVASQMTEVCETFEVMLEEVCETFEVMLEKVASQMTEVCIALNQQVADIYLEYGVSNIVELVYKVKEQGEYDET